MRPFSPGLYEGAVQIVVRTLGLEEAVNLSIGIPTDLVERLLE